MGHAEVLGLPDQVDLVDLGLPFNLGVRAVP